jgi:hypothetical protein
MSETILRLCAGVTGCFSEEHVVVEIEKRDGLLVALVKRAYARPAEVSDGVSHPISESTTNSLIAKIKRILDSPELGGEGRSTTRYYASVESSSIVPTPVNVSSAAMPREALEEFISDKQMNAESRAKAEAILANGYHVWAHELYEVAHQFAAEWARGDA